MRKVYAVLLPIAIWSGCTHSTSYKPELEEAANLHNKAVALAEQLEDRLDSLSEAGSLPADSLTAWRNALAAWAEDLVEVPGNHNHSHEGHGHHHESPPDVTDAQMLEIQQLLLKRMEGIEARINLFESSSLLHNRPTKSIY